MTISLIKVCTVQWMMPLKLLACFAVSTPDGANASRIPSAAGKLQDVRCSRKTQCLQQHHQVRARQTTRRFRRDLAALMFVWNDLKKNKLLLKFEMTFLSECGNVPDYSSKDIRGSFEKFVDWRKCAAVMQREAVTVMPSCSGGGIVVAAWSSSQ
jgi:hypothetical protein